MRKRLLSAVVMTLLGCVIAQFAYAADDSDRFKVEPGVFVGRAGDCGAGVPAGSNIVAAAWVSGIGLPDARGNDSEGLILSKSGATADCSAAGATLRDVRALTLRELGYDIRNGGHCGAGAPRFNVVATDGFHFVGGCANGTRTPSVPRPGWTRVRFDPSNSAQAFPAIAPGATIISIDIVFDEGVDTGVDFSGMAIIDNIDVNGTLVGRR